MIKRKSIRSCKSKLFSKRFLAAFVVTTFILTWMVPLGNINPIAPIQSSTNLPDTQFSTSAGQGNSVLMGDYIVLENNGQSTPARGASLASLLRSYGVAAIVIDVDDLLLNPNSIKDAPAIIIDASVGSDNGTSVSEEVLSILITYDKPIILIGESLWCVHRLRTQGTPLFTAPATQTLTTPLAGVVYLNSPFVIPNNTILTSETLTLPIDSVQSEKSRILNLTISTNPSELPILRYDSFPLDMFLIGLEDPTQWTDAGKNLFVNVVAFAVALGESQTSLTISETQTDGLLQGGLAYFNEPELSNAYYAVHSMFTLLNSTEWASWKTEHQTLIQDLLTDLYVDQGSTAEFMDFATAGYTELVVTAQGLWLVDIMELPSQFNKSKLAAYLSGEQSDGGFGDNVITTFHVTEALTESGYLGTIDTSALSTWLSNCLITSGETSDPDRWGAVGKNPTSIDPRNSYAIGYLQSLSMLGQSHSDPVKLTNWIMTRTGNPDGSYSNSLTPYMEPVKGTASALSSMEIMGTLGTPDKTAGLTWFQNNQLNSGGFGWLGDGEDLAGKTEETSLVALSLDILSETEGTLALGIIEFVGGIETPVGFEGIELLPSMLWGSWLSQSARFAHSGSQMDTDAVSQYMEYFSDLRAYPSWANLTVYNTPENGWDQYRTKSVWFQYLGLAMADNINHQISSEVEADAEGFLVLSQYFTGHFRPTTASGTAHMQHSAAAVEALFMLDSLDSMNYRSALETKVMNDYSSGSWSATGWTLNPFAGTQQAIDWLSTRTALRLGLIDSAMASEISAVINSRIQYDDLWALSRDVATLALLNQTFSVNLEAFDSQLILDALGPTPFADGWFNSSKLWQPVFTADVLEMISILGLRMDICDVGSNAISASIVGIPQIGSAMDIAVIINSPSSVHSLYVNAFDQWTRFVDVANADTVSIQVPDDYSALGPVNISFMVWDYGNSRGYDLAETSISGSFTGDLTIDTPEVLTNDLINGSVAWSLSSGGDAGPTLVKIRLGDQIQYQEWTYSGEESPFSFSIPTTDFDPGSYNLSVTLNKTFCDELVLQQEITILAPDITYISSIVGVIVDVDEQVDIPWSLHLQENDSYISGQIVTLEVRDDTSQLVFSDSGISITGTNHFYWTPDERGNFTFTLSFARNGTLEFSSTSSSIDVFENTICQWSGASVVDQYTTVTLNVELTTENFQPLEGQFIHVIVTSPSASTVIDTILTTNSSGYVSFDLMLSENGFYSLSAYFDGALLLKSSNDFDGFISHSTSSIVVGGITSEGFVNDSWNLWSQLTDSLGLPVSGESVTIRVIFLPSTIVFETTLTTNSTGHSNVLWIASNPGSYSVEAIYGGSTSRDSDLTHISPINLYVPLLFDLDESSPLFEVGVSGFIVFYITDHTATAVTGLTVQFVVRDPLNSIVYQTTDVTDGFGFVNFTFTPSVRGLNNISLTSNRQAWYECGLYSENHGIVEEPIIEISLEEDALAPSSNSLLILIKDQTLTGISDISIHTVVILASGVIIDLDNLTLADGSLTFVMYLSEPGLLEVTITLNAQGWLTETNKQFQDDVLGITDLDITGNALPIDQGTPQVIQTILLDWEGLPLSGATVTISIEWPNGTIIDSEDRTTGIDGVCVLAHTFIFVGDFIVRATYAGENPDAPAETLVVQRVTITPNLVLLNAPTCTVGEIVEFQIGLRDAYEYVAGRTLILTLMMHGENVFETQVTSENTLKSVHWTASERGLVNVVLTHSSDSFYLDNSTQSSISSLELISGVLTLTSDTMDLFDSVVLMYNLSGTVELENVTIVFEILGMDLVPVWTIEVSTNSSGIALTSYTADDEHGVLTVRAEPKENQFLIGGGSLEQLTVMTNCFITTAITPAPAALGGTLNITIEGIDDLGNAIDDVEIRVYLNDPYGQPIKLGSFTNYIVVTLIEGSAIVSFTPSLHGSHELIVESSGNNVVHAFYHNEFHTVHNPTTLTFISLTENLQVDDELSVTVRLTNYFNDALEGMIVTITLGALTPVDLVTNENGTIQWTTIVGAEGQFILAADFAGSGVYLSINENAPIDVRFGTVVSASILSSWDVIAGLTPLTVDVLLEDTDGTPLEGRSITYSVYHDQLGLLLQDSIIQQGQSPEEFNITINRMGSYTIVFSFEGTSHYFPSSTALEIFVKGTSTLEIAGESILDRANETILDVILNDELGTTLSPVDVILDLVGPTTTLGDRISYLSDMLNVNLTGLPVGHYSLTVTLLDTAERIGCSEIHTFTITSECRINIVSQETSSIVGEVHTVTLSVLDSINETITNMPIFVSLFAPDGREIYGNILSSRTELNQENGVFVVEWTPSSTGNYTLTIDFEGDDLLGQHNITLVFVMKITTYFEVTIPAAMNYSQSETFTLTLFGGLSRLSGENVRVLFLDELEVIREMDLTTGYQGRIQFDVEHLPAGNLTVIVSFEGSDRYASSNYETFLIVYPEIEIVIELLGSTFVNINVILKLDILVRGVDSSSTLTMTALVYNPQNEVEFNQTLEINADGSVELSFLPITEGLYKLELHLSGLPLGIEHDVSTVYNVIHPPVELIMDAGTTPVVGGGAVLLFIGLAIRKKLTGVIDSIPAEWDAA